MDKNLFKGKKVLIMGLGLHGGGVGVAKFFCKQGADVLVTDLKTKEQLADSIKKLKTCKVKYALGGHEEKDFLWADLIIKNPDVPSISPYLEIARKHNKSIETDITLFFRLSKAFIIGVTGTKGKSTTASLIFHLIKPSPPAGGKRVFLAGNIGISPLELLPKIKQGDKVVLELSSFELEDLKQSPNIAVVTNIMPDHLNRYATMEEYVEAKKNIFKFQNDKDFFVLNEDDSYCLPRRSLARRRVRQKVVYFSAKKSPALANIAAATEVAKILEVPEEIIEKQVASFKDVHSRQEFIKEVRGVKYFNDTTATIPEAVIFAIDSFSEKFPAAKIFIICGGVYKGVNYTKMADKIKERNVGLIMLPGSASDKIKESLPGYGEIYPVSSMHEAVEKSARLARKGDLVVLSPAASSFNMFKNEFDRGEQFIKSVKKLK